MSVKTDGWSRPRSNNELICPLRCLIWHFGHKKVRFLCGDQLTFPRCFISRRPVMNPWCFRPAIQRTNMIKNDTKIGSAGRPNIFVFVLWLSCWWSRFLYHLYHLAQDLGHFFLPQIPTHQGHTHTQITPLTFYNYTEIKIFKYIFSLQLDKCCTSTRPSPGQQL